MIVVQFQEQPVMVDCPQCDELKHCVSCNNKIKKPRKSSNTLTKFFFLLSLFVQVFSLVPEEVNVPEILSLASSTPLKCFEGDLVLVC